MTFAWGFLAGFLVWPIGYILYEAIDAFREFNSVYPTDL